MKKIILLLAVLFSLNSFSQSYTKMRGIGLMNLTTPSYILEMLDEGKVKKSTTIAEVFNEIPFKRTDLPIETNKNLDTVLVTLTLRAQDWAWGIGNYGSGADSASAAKVRALRSAIQAANPATWATNVTINNIPGQIALFLYRQWLNCPTGAMLNMGNTQAERATIYTNVRALTNSEIQYSIGLADGYFQGLFLDIRNRGKAILIDN